ncbi:alpha/beta fold hydrolase [Nonomuraea sp. NPDC049400]|uniref:alpha/beta fold hydrolase n=1 Tax=Nonomuraea sp. NPDC049400 TaxID=3364352 RepID=UPI0037B3287B
MPVRLVTGELDPLIDATLDARVTVIPGTGHHPQLTHPAHVAAVAKANVPIC